MAVSEGEVEMLLEEHGVGGASEHEMPKRSPFLTFCPILTTLTQVETSTIPIKMRPI